MTEVGDKNNREGHAKVYFNTLLALILVELIRSCLLIMLLIMAIQFYYPVLISIVSSGYLTQ